MIGLANYIEAAFNSVLIQIVVRVIFGIMRWCFTIFTAIAKINIFNGELYTTITNRIYSIISIVMLFVFAYQIILLIINPDKDTKALSSVVKDIFISVVLIVLLPMIFRYASILQNHVIDDNTIPAIILGQSGADSDTQGRQMIKMVFTSFFHPTGTNYETFYTDDGNLVEDKCESVAKGDNASEICKKYIAGLKEFESHPNDNIFDSFAGKTWALVKYDGNDGFTCDAIIMAVVGVYITWIFLSYAIDLGTRAVKLFALEVIAPVPVILRILPKSKGSFDKWLKELMKTYLEVFARLAFIFFVVFMCSQIPAFLSIVAAGMDGNHKIIATMVLILGILKFAKDAPEMLKKMFSMGFFEGIDFKPGVKRRIGDSMDTVRKMPIVDKGWGAASGALGSGWTSMVNGNGFSKGARAGAMNGFKDGGSQFNSQRQKAYNELGFKGKAGWFGGERWLDKKSYEMADRNLADNYADDVLPRKIKEKEQNSPIFIAKFNDAKQQYEKETREATSWVNQYVVVNNNVKAAESKMSAYQESARKAEIATHENDIKDYTNKKAKINSEISRLAQQIKDEMANPNYYNSDESKSYVAKLNDEIEKRKKMVSAQDANIEKSRATIESLKNKVYSNASIQSEIDIAKNNQKNFLDSNGAANLSGDELSKFINDKQKIASRSATAIEELASSDARKYLKDKDKAYNDLVTRDLDRQRDKKTKAMEKEWNSDDDFQKQVAIMSRALKNNSSSGSNGGSGNNGNEKK